MWTYFRWLAGLVVVACALPTHSKPPPPSPLHELILASDLIVVGRLARTSESVEDDLVRGTGWIEVERVVFGNAGDELVFTWATSHPPFCPQKTYRASPQSRVLMFLRWGPNGTVRAATYYESLSLDRQHVDLIDSILNSPEGHLNNEAVRAVLDFLFDDLGNDH
jgi:hypothetical protein